VPASTSWCAAVRRLGGDPTAAAAAGAELERRWAEPHRHYHSTAHLEAVLRDAEWLAGEVRLGEDDGAVVALAACAHDVVYEGRAGADEQASAEWARERLAACGLAAETVARVGALVLATVDHVAGDDRAAEVLLDADLAILGAAPEDYARYVAAVRAEYAAVPDDEFRRGRARVVAALRDRDQLYRTEPARRRWEAQARHNLAAELAALGGAVSPPSG
jgi:predicted metal-dependent HD superfamily phosphohydrolase